MFNDRYCEVLAVHGTFPNLLADVWNTYGLNNCPPGPWQALDEKAVATELGALAVRLNGPRYWLIDRASIRLAPGMGQIHSFGSLRMREIAQVQVPITNGVPGLAPYTETTVLRKNTFTWGQRRRIYELVGPDGSVYVMQACSHSGRSEASARDCSCRPAGATAAGSCITTCHCGPPARRPSCRTS
jgi:hypothetical protein